MSASKQRLKLVILGVPVLILIFASLAGSAFLAVSLIISGVRDSLISSVVLGTLLASLWILMLAKTARARQVMAKNNG